MQTLYRLVACILLIVVFSPSSAQHQEFPWLLGTWKLKDKNAFEIWTLGKDGKTLEGISYRIEGSDTTATEAIRLLFKNNAFFYVPDVTGDQSAVDFKITHWDAASFVAENPVHDFPKIIRYTFIRKGREDWIEASIEGDEKVIPYTFSRVK